MSTHHRVLVAMSGGVDSSVTAYLLQQQGYECIGATMLLACSGTAADACGSTRDMRDAETVCRRLGIPWHALDERGLFSKAVVDKFVRTYEEGRTPNPCIDCNRHLKFGALLDYALELGCDAVATGHYARVRPLGELPGGTAQTDDPTLQAVFDRSANPGLVNTLSCGIDASKDQSYVLYSLTQERLAHTVLPLGDLIKERDVRRIAREQGFDNAGKRDSQGICFVPNNDFAGYIEHLHGEPLATGDVLDAHGNVLGRHAGAIRYTIGQRKGLGVACLHPVYVIATDAAANTVTLGEREDLRADGLLANDWIWSLPADIMTQLLEEAGTEGIAASARIRYHHASRACRLSFAGDADTGCIRIAFDEPEYAIAPGQAVVAYLGDVVVGGGTVVGAL